MISLSKIKLGKKEIDSVVKVLKSGQLAQGKVVLELEKKFAKFCGTKYALAVNNGTAAIHSALYACGIKNGDEIITTPFTFVATANPILMMGAIPVFVDIDEKTFNIDHNKIEAAITKKTKAIIAVNLYGQPAEYEKINKIAKKYKLLVIEDAAQSIGAEYKGKMSGNLADIGCFSFYATKNIMSGEGGMITTNNKLFYERARMFRHHGENHKKRYEYYDLGYNYRLTDVLAALALSQLDKVKTITKVRQNIAKKYLKAFSPIKEIGLSEASNDRTHVYHQFVLQIKKNSKITRDKLKKYLLSKGIETNIHYPKLLNNFKHLKSATNDKSKFPVANKIVQEVLSIPAHPHLKKNEINYIIRTISAVFS